MVKYIVIRVALIILNIFLFGSLLFFALNFANFNKYSSMEFSQYFQVTKRMYKIFLEQRLLEWDWGITENGDSIREAVVPKFWVSLKYNLIALALYFPVGIILGMLSALKKNSWFDQIVNTVALIFGSIPTYILTFFLIVVLGFRWDIFPPHFSSIQPGFWGSILGLGIPILALSAGAITKISRVMRDEMSDFIGSEFYLLARTKGMTKTQIFFRHLFRNSISGVLPIMLEVFMLVLMGSFFVEMIFGISGVAQLMYDGMIRPFADFWYILIDINTIIVICLFYLVVGSLFALVVDVAYYLIDPRIKTLHTKTE